MTCLFVVSLSEKRQSVSSLRRNLGYPLMMVLLLFLTVSPFGLMTCSIPLACNHPSGDISDHLHADGGEEYVWSAHRSEGPAKSHSGPSSWFPSSTFPPFLPWRSFSLLELQEIVLGISSISTLGPLGATIQISIILYPLKLLSLSSLTLECPLDLHMHFWPLFALDLLSAISWSHPLWAFTLSRSASVCSRGCMIHPWPKSSLIVSSFLC